MRRFAVSLSFRLALTYVALFAGSLLLLASAYYLLTIHMPARNAETLVAREARTLANIYIVDGQAALLPALARREHQRGQRKAFHAFVDARGRTVAANLPSWPRAPMAGLTRLEADLFRDGVEEDFEALVLDRRFEDGARLIVGRDVGDLTERERALESGATIMLAVALALGVLGGALMSRAIGRRIEDVAETARSVIAGDLAGRVPVRGSDDDFDRLAGTLNLMLARMEQAMDAVRRVSDSVAHELRTPVLRLQADLEELAQASVDEDRRRLVAAALAEADRLGTIFSAVLRIARIEAGRHEIDATAVDLAQLVADMAGLYEPALHAKGQCIALALASAACVTGDRQLLAQAIANLIDNAVKHAPAGAVIRAGVTAAPEVTLSIANPAAALPAADVARLGERFFRATAEAVPGEGLGLGLSLVRAVADRHGADLCFASGPTGFEVRWRFAERPPSP